tara:strand:+ start:6566 stop:7663 length:1098 start_codon:yes stop_codon:yes gene_type:complete
MISETKSLVHKNGNAITIFTEGDYLYDAMWEDIASARHTVWLESYIFSDDEIGRKFIDVLKLCQDRGVAVRVRVDAFGSRLGWPGGLAKQLRHSGIKFERCLPFQWLKPWLFHRRNHRKLLVVDEAVAYLGGFNIDALNSRKVSGSMRWRDTHLRLTGPIASQAAKSFLSLSYQTADYLCDTDNQPIILLNNYSRDCGHLLRCLLSSQLRRAKTRIWLTTPYFVPDGKIQAELCRAAKRGVDVKVLVPGKTDAPIVRWAAHASYSHLLAAGVRIYEYQARMLHAKTLIVDTDWCTVGTSNLDYRSLFINYELNLAASFCELNEQLESIFLDDLMDAKQIQPKAWLDRSFISRLAEWIGWIARHWL